MLKALLLLRGAFNLVLGLALLVLSQERTLSGYGRGGLYALVDGLLALAVAVLLLRSRGRWLAVLAFPDALVRVILGIMVLANPGMDKSVFGQVFFLATVVVACIGLGVGGIAYVLVVGRRQRAQEGDEAMGRPALVICVLTLLLGVGLAFGFLEHERRLMLVGYAIAIGCTLCLAGYRLGSSAGPRTASTSL
jgi:hypothetical protein